MDIFLNFWKEMLGHSQEILERNMKFLNEVARPVPRPKWHTKNNTILDIEQVTLRRFSEGKDGIPTLIIPPQAGHHSNIADYGKGQSLVEAALKHAKGEVYVTEWKPANKKLKDKGIDDCILSMKECINEIGGKASLVGLCQGGWQSAIYTALYPEDVSSLVLAAAPIDCHAGKSAITDSARSIPMSWFKAVVKQSGGIMPGEDILFGFKMMHAYDRFVKDNCNLYLNIDDENYVKRSRKFKDWYDYTQPLPGMMYLQAVSWLFKGNRLIKGKLKILKREVRLSEINHPLYLIAGSKDDITPQEQLFSIEKHVSSNKVEKHIVPAGHIGVFMGRKVLKEYWPKILSSI
ncbi:MAG: alpha/beta fold hydrolase [Candidatus Woesearchaeota archaeon]